MSLTLDSDVITEKCNAQTDRQMLDKVIPLSCSVLFNKKEINHRSKAVVSY